jgi:hypothetical protein
MAGSTIIKYRHGLGPVRIPEDNPILVLSCLTQGEGEEELKVAILESFSPNIDFYDPKCREDDFPTGYLGEIYCPLVTQKTIQNIIRFLKGSPLPIPVGSATTALTKEQKISILLYSNFAHLFDIEVLQRAAMHALCAATKRRPQDWADKDANMALLRKHTYYNNPIWQVMASLPVPDLHYRYGMCEHKGLDMLWKKDGGSMALIPEDDADELSDDLDEGELSE